MKVLILIILFMVLINCMPALLFTSFLLHGYSPNSMILGTMIPIPKDKRTSLCDYSNYRAIALSSMFRKVLDWIIFMK